MTTYTTTPLPPIDTLNSHTGFWLFSIVFCMFILVFIVQYQTYECGGAWTTIKLIAISLVMGAVSYGSFTNGEIKTFANVPTDATMVGMASESWTETRREGKRNVEYVVHGRFVSYRVPDGVVSFKTEPGQVWPETAVLYKN